MLDLDLTWQRPASRDEGRQIVPVMGSSTVDETVALVELLVDVGSTVRAGQTVAVVEADKAAADMASPADGVVEALPCGPAKRFVSACR